MPLLPFLAPAALFALLSGGVMVTETPRELYNLLRDLGGEGLGGLTVALFLVGGGLGLRIGQVRACPTCGAWWASVTATEDAPVTITEGGHFHGTEGWVQTRETTAGTDATLVCRSCGHTFRRRLGAARRMYTRPLGAPKRHRPGD